MNSMLRSSGLASLAAAIAIATAPAQTAARDQANRFVPENSTVVLRVAAPAKWRERFATTQAIKLMQADTLSPLLDQLSAGMDMALDQLRTSGAFDADLCESLLTKWQGDIVLSVQIDAQAVLAATMEGDMPQFSVMLALTPGGDYDLGALAAEISRAAEDADEDLRDLVVGDLTLRRSGLEGDPDATVPTMIDGALVMLIGSDLEADAGKLLATDHRHTGAIGDDPFHLHVDLKGLMPAILQVMDMQLPPDGVDMMSSMLEAIGLGAMQHLTMSLDADGPQVTGTFTLGLAAKERGMFGLFGCGNNQPRLLRAVPPDAETFSVASMRFAAGFDLIAEIWKTLGDEVPLDFDSAMQTFTEATKVRLREDLIDKLGEELLVVQDSQSMAQHNPDDEDELDAIAGSVYGIALRDGKAFGASLETALRSRGLHAGRKTEDYASQQVHRMRVAGVLELEYVVTEDMLLIGIGGNENAQRILRSVLDTRTAEATGLPASVRPHVAALPGGWNSVQCTALPPLLQMLANGFESNMQFGTEGEMAAEVLRGVAADLRRLKIESIVATTYDDQQGMTTRFRW